MKNRGTSDKTTHMGDSDKHPISFLRYVHKPYRKPDIYADATPRKAFDHTRLYRIFVADPDTGILVDVQSPGCVGDSEHMKELTLIRTFYVGAEQDLDRYLRWLTNVGMRDEHEVPRDLCVIEQLSEFFQKEIQQLSQRDARFVTIFPGQLTYYGILTSGSKEEIEDSWELY
jgi:hypothetical protein